MNTHRQEFLDVIVESINQIVESSIEDTKQNPLYGDAHFYMFENKRRVSDFPYLLDELHSEQLAAHTKKALSLNVSEDLIIEALKESVNIEVGGIYVPNNAVDSWHIGEQEYQFEELREVLSELDSEEVEYLKSNLDAYWDGKSDCVYVDMSYDVIWMTCSSLTFKRNLNKLIKEAVK